MSVYSPRRHKNPLPPDLLLEVLDGADKPLMLMPQEQVVRQKLRHHTVFVCVRRYNNNIFLHKHPADGNDIHGELWNVSASGRVIAGESRHDAALRRLRQELGITGVDILKIAQITPASSIGNMTATLYITAKTSAIPRFDPQKDQEGMYVDQEELQALLRDFPHIVTPYLHIAAQYIYAAGFMSE